VDISLDLSVDRLCRSSRVCAAAFTNCVNSGVSGGRWTFDSLATLIHAVVNLRMDYCNTVLAGAPRTVTNILLTQRALNAAARVITGTRMFDRGLNQILHDRLHWLDVPDQVLFSSPVSERLHNTHGRSLVFRFGG